MKFRNANWIHEALPALYNQSLEPYECLVMDALYDGYQRGHRRSGIAKDIREGQHVGPPHSVLKLLLHGHEVWQQGVHSES